MPDCWFCSSAFSHITKNCNAFVSCCTSIFSRLHAVPLFWIRYKSAAATDLTAAVLLLLLLPTASVLLRLQGSHCVLAINSNAFPGEMPPRLELPPARGHVAGNEQEVRKATLTQVGF
jgi:hypothetical protein